MTCAIHQSRYPGRALARWILACFVLALWLLPVRALGQERAGADKTDKEARSFFLKKARHLAFDERVIMGQSLKSGAIYLFERKDSDIHSLIKIRQDYRKEISAPLEKTY